VVWRYGLLKREQIGFVTTEMDSWTLSEGIASAVKVQNHVI
jgi:hypothetical protein